MHFETRQLALSAFLGNLHIIMGVIIAVGVAGIISSGLDAPQNGEGSLVSPSRICLRWALLTPLRRLSWLDEIPISLIRSDISWFPFVFSITSSLSWFAKFPAW